MAGLRTVRRDEIAHVYIDQIRMPAALVSHSRYDPEYNDMTNIDPPGGAWQAIERVHKSPQSAYPPLMAESRHICCWIASTSPSW